MLEARKNLQAKTDCCTWFSGKSGCSGCADPTSDRPSLVASSAIGAVEPTLPINPKPSSRWSCSAQHQISSCLCKNHAVVLNDWGDKKWKQNEQHHYSMTNSFSTLAFLFATDNSRMVYHAHMSTFSDDLHPLRLRCRIRLCSNRPFSSRLLGRRTTCIIYWSAGVRRSMIFKEGAAARSKGTAAQSKCWRFFKCKSVLVWRKFQCVFFRRKNMTCFQTIFNPFVLQCYLYNKNKNKNPTSIWPKTYVIPSITKRNKILNKPIHRPTIIISRYLNPRY